MAKNLELLTGKKALVTGASRGIGRAIALRFASQGSDVCFTYNSQKALAEGLLEEIGSLPGAGKARSFKLDVSDPGQVTSVVQEATGVMGGLDVLVNNAGITSDGLLLRMEPKDWDKVIQTNLSSVFNAVRASSRHFLKQRSGSIINISSIVGIRGNAGQANYAASKAGIIGFSKSVALEFGSRNIRCNVVAPGFIETDMTRGLDPKAVASWLEGIPLKRAGKPEDVADVCVFLASSLSCYITGQVLQVDGGQLT